MCPADEPFPHKPQTLEPGVWQEASLPLGRLPPDGKHGTAELRHFDKLTFRVSEENPLDLCLADLRLSGPKGERPLDDFARGRTWRGGRQAMVAGPAEGEHALRVSLPRGTSFVWRAGFNTTFSLADYDRIRFSWMLQGIEQGWNNSLILRVDGSPNDFHVALRPQNGRVTRARAEAHDGDQFGQFEAAGWCTDDSQLRRRMILLREGILVVEDQLLPGRQADGWTAGPLWQLFAPPVEGKTWFDAPGPRRLLVWFGSAPGRSVGVETVRLWSGSQPYTVFARERLKAGQPVRFATVLVPHREGIAARDLAKGIHLEQAAGRPTKLRLDLPLAKTLVTIEPGGTWAVQRQQ